MQTDRLGLTRRGPTLDRMDATRIAFHVGIVLALTGPITDDQLKALKSETAALWHRYNVDIVWFDPNADFASDELVYTSPVDRMIWLATDSRPPSDASLGSVRFRNGAPGDTIRLRYMALSQMVLNAKIGSWPIRALPPPLRDRVVGQALGRVVAHELGHVLLGLPTHDRSGLMRPTFVPEDLVGWDREALRLSKNFVHRLDERLSRQVTP